MPVPVVNGTFLIGIAVQLGQAGAKVYITGRSVDKLQECANEINKRGGIVIHIHGMLFATVTLQLGISLGSSCQSGSFQ